MPAGLEAPSQAIGAEKEMLGQESRRRLKEALADLSPQQRQVLQLRLMHCGIAR